MMGEDLLMQVYQLELFFSKFKSRMYVEIVSPPVKQQRVKKLAISWFVAM
jgi:hypothetical protein